VTLSYELTFEDYREANLGTTAAAAAKSNAFRGVFGWILFIGLAITMFLLLNARPSRQAPVEELPPAAPQLWRIAAALIPSALFSGLIWFLGMKSLGKSGPKPWDPPPQTPGAANRKKGKPAPMLFGWLLFIGLAVMLFMLLQNNSRPPRRPTFTSPSGTSTSPSGTHALEPPKQGSLETFDYLIGAVPWVALCVLLLVMSRSSVAGRGLQQTWDNQPALHRRQTVEATESGIVFTGELSRNDYQWGHFAGFKETANLLLLYQSPYSFHVIPKRAFPTQTDMEIFRRYLLTGVKQGFFLPQTSAFPIIPMAQRSDAADRT
jgi:hypothetical protein